MQAAYELVPLIADIISAHCPATRARDDFLRASSRGEWEEVRSMVEGMLAEPWYLKGNQENRLQEFLDLMQVDQCRIGQRSAA